MTILLNFPIKLINELISFVFLESIISFDRFDKILMRGRLYEVDCCSYSIICDEIFKRSEILIFASCFVKNWKTSLFFQFFKMN